MALDNNLFTLNLEPSKIEPGAIDLVDPSGTVHYRKQSLPNEAGTYLILLSEPLSESILATAAAPAATTKEKVIELHNPSVLVNLTSKGTLTFKWTFNWEEHKFVWKRDDCYIIRKPDPPVLVAVTKEPPSKSNKPKTVQILDYNLNRFDIEDRKGLEIVLLISLLTFGDLAMEQMRAKSNEAPSTVPNVPVAIVVPPPPPKPEGWTEDQVAVLQAQEQREVNEVVVGEQGDIDGYVKHCVSLLNDDTLLFITLRSLTPACVAKVVQVAEATKRRRYKESGYDDERELHQYVDTTAGQTGKGKGPRVINLDDNPKRVTSYQPPNTLTIHLSKIAMPELEPKTNKPSPLGKYSQIASEPVPHKPSKSSQEEQTGATAPSRQTPSSNGKYSTQSTLPPSSTLGSQASSTPPGSDRLPVPSHHGRSTRSSSQPQLPYPTPSQQPPPKQQQPPPKQQQPPPKQQQLPPPQPPSSKPPPRAQNLNATGLQYPYQPYNQQSPNHTLRGSAPRPVSIYAPYPSQGLPNAPHYVVYGMAPPQPPPQRPPGKGFFGRW